MAAIYANLEEMPASFETTCERPSGETLDICALLKGWIIAKGTFTVIPNYPGKSRLIMKTRINITAETGRLDFNYVLEERATQAESLKIRIDGEITSKINKYIKDPVTKRQVLSKERQVVEVELIKENMYTVWVKLKSGETISRKKKDIVSYQK